MSSLYRLIYGSRAELAQFGGASEVTQIVETSRRNNAAVDVTGILICHDGVFIQALEGPKQAVEAVYQRVSGDPRHSDIRIVSTEVVGDRLFGSWSMCAAELAANDALILTFIGDAESLDPEFLDPVPTLNLLSAVAQMQDLPAQAA